MTSTPSAVTRLYPFVPLALVALMVNVSVEAGIPVGPTGSGIITFAGYPGVTNFSTRSLGSSDSIYNTAAAVDAAVNGSTNAASTIVNALIDFSPTNPPAQNALASWTSGGTAYVQTRPTGVGATELMATLLNSTGSNVTGLTISYTLGAAGTIKLEQVDSHQVYYSISGAAGSWTKISTLSDAAVGTVSATIAIPSGWPAGTAGYLLWVDDNSTNGTDNAWTIDNLSIGALVGVLPLTVTLTSPTNTQHFTSSALNPANVTIVAAAPATIPATNVAFYTNGVLAVNDATAPYSATVRLPVGTHTVYARAANSSEISYSATNTIIVREEFLHYLGGTVAESFNGMNAGTETPIGWYVDAAPPVDNTMVTVGTGSVGAGSTIMGWNYATSSGDPDRALGVAATTADRNIVVRIVNDSGATINACDIRYDGEVWRNYTNAMGGWLSNMVSVNLGATWVPTGFDFEQPATTPRAQPQVAVNGHLAANRTANIGGPLMLPAPVPPGGVIYVRWLDPNDSGVTDGGLAINNFSFTAIPGNAAPVLMPIQDIAVDAGVQIVKTNAAFDTNLPVQQLTFSFASPAPSGATISSNGIFRWRPGAANAGTTNLIGIRVFDNGVPSLGATQWFRVMVQDYVAPSLGLFIMRAGETGAVPVRVFSSAGLSSLSFSLLYPPTMLGDLGLRALAPQIETGTLQELSPGVALVHITNYAGQLLQGTQQVALLAFTALADHSAFVPITITNIVATRANGTAVADTAVQSGRVIVIANEPLVEATMRTNNQRTVVVYGKPGASYRLESSATFDPSQPWQTEGDLILPDMSATFDVAPTNRASFFRAREL